MLKPPSVNTAPETDDEGVQLVLKRAELAARIERHFSGEGLQPTAIPRLNLIRASRPTEKTHTLYEPALCLLAQGRKRVMLGEEPMHYDALNYLVVSQNLPVTGQVVDATPESPYLGIRLDIDPSQIAALMLDIGTPPGPRQPSSTRGLFTGHADVALLDAVLRLMKLLESPQDIAALAPLVAREILYRLLTSEQGWRLAQIGLPDSQSQRISRAITWLRDRYREPLKIEDMAQALHMSSSSLHHHFKAVTAMSPLQYQKQLRLQEARRLLLV
jgi:hypothetical protein